MSFSSKQLIRVHNILPTMDKELTQEEIDKAYKILSSERVNIFEANEFCEHVFSLFHTEPDDEPQFARHQSALKHIIAELHDKYIDPIQTDQIPHR